MKKHTTCKFETIYMHTNSGVVRNSKSGVRNSNRSVKSGIGVAEWSGLSHRSGRVE
ncbi:hypothetical protein LguiB_020987 [Lonicera macranthoides]